MKSKKEAVLNIGSEKLSLVVIDEKYPSSFIYESFKEYSGYQNGEFLEKHELFSTLSSMIQESEAAIFSKLENILIGVPGEFTITSVRDVQTQLSQTRRKVQPKDAQGLLLHAAPEATDKFIPINASPIFYVLDGNEKTLNPEGSYAQYLGAKVSFILCEKYFIDLFSSIFESIGRKIEYTSTLLAETMFLLPHTARDRGSFLLDIGYISTSLAYSKGDGILFLKSFSLGGGFIAADLMEVLKIPYEHAYALKSKINLNLNPINSDMYYITVNDGNYAYPIKKVNEIATARVQDICNYVKQAIGLLPYDTHEFTTVYLTGSGFDNVVGSREILSKIIEMNVEIIGPSLIQYDKLSYAGLSSLLSLKRSQAKVSFGSKIKSYLKNIFRRG